MKVSCLIDFYLGEILLWVFFLYVKIWMFEYNLILYKRKFYLNLKIEYFYFILFFIELLRRIER